jgi:VanZ family protein
MSKYLRYLPLTLWSILIFSFSSQPAVSVARETELDVLFHKLAHLFEYAVLYIFYVLAFYRRSRKPLNTMIHALAFVAVFGATDEFHQLFTPTRGPKVSDIIVDTTGGIIGYALARIYFSLKKTVI